jgi:MFS family permease
MRNAIWSQVAGDVKMWCNGQLLAGLACVAVFSGLTNGWNLKVGGLVLVRIENNYPSPDSPMHVANSEFMLVGGILFLGICIGALVNGPIVEQLGTRTTSIIGEVTIILGTAIGVLASNEHWLIIWRLVGGIGMGICITSKPLYIVELSPKLYAGRLLAVLATSITLSMILAEASDMLIPHALAWIDVWRLLIALGMVFPTLLALFLCFCMPHTPAYFSTQGKTAAEEQPLARTSRESSAAPAAGAARATARVEAPDVAPGADFSCPLATVLAAFVIAKECNGGSVLMILTFEYLNERFEYESAVAHACGMGLSAILLCSCVAGFFLVDSPVCGRRPLAVGGCTGCVVANTLIAASFALQGAGHPSGRAILPVALILNAMSSMSVHIAFYPAATELLPLSLRSRWLGVVFAAAQVLAFGVTTLGSALAASDAATCALFVGSSVLMAICACVLGALLPETRPC